MLICYPVYSGVAKSPPFSIIGGAVVAKKFSKNNPTNKSIKSLVKVVTSDVCEECSQKCKEGEAYLIRLKTKGSGNGAVCKKEVI
jgi:hypothetical protein